MCRKAFSGLLLFIFSNIWYAQAQDKHSVAHQWDCAQGQNSSVYPLPRRPPKNIRYFKRPSLDEELILSVASVQSLHAMLKSRPHKQHIWFLPTQKPTQKKPKELFFANARQGAL